MRCSLTSLPTFIDQSLHWNLGCVKTEAPDGLLYSPWCYTPEERSQQDSNATCPLFSVLHNARFSPPQTEYIWWKNCVYWTCTDLFLLSLFHKQYEGASKGLWKMKLKRILVQMIVQSMQFVLLLCELWWSLTWMNFSILSNQVYFNSIFHKFKKKTKIIYLESRMTQRERERPPTCWFTF